MAHIVRPSTAFQEQRRRKPMKARDHLAFVRALPCISCGRDPAGEAAVIYLHGCHADETAARRVVLMAQIGKER